MLFAELSVNFFPELIPKCLNLNLVTPAFLPIYVCAESYPAHILL